MPAQREGLGADHVGADGRHFGEIQGGQIGTQPGEFGAGSGMGEAAAIQNSRRRQKVAIRYYVSAWVRAMRPSPSGYSPFAGPRPS